MYVCVCNPVSDKQIAQAAREGACCMRDLRDRLGVGAQCGQCVPMAKELLREHGAPVDRRAAAAAPIAPAPVASESIQAERAPIEGAPAGHVRIEHAPGQCAPAERAPAELVAMAARRALSSSAPRARVEVLAA